MSKSVREKFLKGYKSMIKNEQNMEELMEYLERWREGNGFSNIEASCYEEFCRLSSTKELKSYFRQMKESYSKINDIAQFYITRLSKQVTILEARGINDDFIEAWMNVLADTDDNLGDAASSEDWFEDLRDRIKKWENIESFLKYVDIKNYLYFGDNVRFFDIKKDEYSATKYSLEIETNGDYDDPMGQKGYIFINLTEDENKTCIGIIEFSYTGKNWSEEDYMDDDIEYLEEISDIAKNLKEFADEESKKMNAITVFFEGI